MVDYFQDMLLEGDPALVFRLSPEQLDTITKYINDPMTASSIPSSMDKKRSTPEIVTSELVYYWMTVLKINWEAQDWHFNRLMMLIQITNFKSQPESKRSKGQVLADWREMNARNKKLFGTKG